MTEVLCFVLIFSYYLKAAQSIDNEELFYKLISENTSKDSSVDNQHFREYEEACEGSVRPIVIDYMVPKTVSGSLESEIIPSSNMQPEDDTENDLYNFLEEFQATNISIKTVDDNQQPLLIQDEKEMETLVSIISPDDVMLSIQNQSDKIYQTVQIILEKSWNRRNNWYRRRFNRTKELSKYYVLYYDKAITQNRIDYTSADQRIKTLFFDITYYEDGRVPLMVFSDKKFLIFLSMNKMEFFASLAVCTAISYELLNVIEFFTIQKYYQVIPELIILERIRVVSMSQQINLFYHIRSLNMVLNYCIKESAVLPGFRDKIYLFIDKIISSETRMNKCNIKREKRKYFILNPCGRNHINYFYIFSYNFDADSRNKFVHRRTYRLSGLLDQVKTVSLYFIYNHLLLNTYLLFQQYDSEKINNFLRFIERQDICLNCVMEECVSIISNK